MLVLAFALIVPTASAEETEVSWVVHDAVSEFGIYVNGAAVDFSDAHYQDRSAVVALRDGNGARIHTNWNGITFGMFLTTLGWSIEGECLVGAVGERYCGDIEGGSLHAYSGGSEVTLAALAAHELRGGEVLGVVYAGPVQILDHAHRPALVQGVAALAVGLGLAVWVLVRRRRPVESAEAWRPTTSVLAAAFLASLVGGAALAAAGTVFVDEIRVAPPIVVVEKSLVVAERDGARIVAYVGDEAPLTPPVGWPAPVAALPTDAWRAFLGHAEGDVIEVSGALWRIVSIVPITKREE